MPAAWAFHCTYRKMRQIWINDATCFRRKDKGLNELFRFLRKQATQDSVINLFLPKHRVEIQSPVRTSRLSREPKWCLRQFKIRDRYSRHKRRRQHHTHHPWLFPHWRPLEALSDLEPNQAHTLVKPLAVLPRLVQHFCLAGPKSTLLSSNNLPSGCPPREIWTWARMTAYRLAIGPLVESCRHTLAQPRSQGPPKGPGTRLRG